MEVENIVQHDQRYQRTVNQFHVDTMEQMQAVLHQISVETISGVRHDQVVVKHVILDIHHHQIIVLVW